MISKEWPEGSAKGYRSMELRVNGEESMELGDGAVGKQPLSWGESLGKG